MTCTTAACSKHTYTSNNKNNKKGVEAHFLQPRDASRPKNLLFHWCPTCALCFLALTLPCLVLELLKVFEHRLRPTLGVVHAPLFLDIRHLDDPIVHQQCISQRTGALWCVW